MGLGSVFEVGVRILRRHYGVLLMLALIFIGPAALLTAATGVRLSEVAVAVLPINDEGLIDSGPIALTPDQLERLGGAIVALLLATSFAGVLATVAALGFSAIVGADYHGRSMNLSETVRACLRGALAVLGVVIVTTVIIVAIIAAGVGLSLGAVNLLGSGGIQQGGPGVFVALILVVAMVLAVVYLTMRWAMAVPAIALDGEGARGALRRSWHLTADNIWRTFAAVMLATLATAILSAVVSGALALVVVDVFAAQLGLDVVIAETVVLAAASVLVAPLLPVVVAVLYHDLKVRRDS
jgi:hypothetical protein